MSISISPSLAVLTEGMHNADLNDFQEHVTAVFDLGSAVFSAFIIVLTVVAYRNLRSKRILLISIAFILFFTRSIFSFFDLVQPEILEIFLSVLSFGGLVFFVIAIFQLGRFKLWKTNSNHYFK
ncbi:MAG: hypothetical protein AB7F29_13040 [Candidatus Nitrosocosmicus sp.]